MLVINQTFCSMAANLSTMKATAEEIFMKDFKSGKEAAMKELYKSFSKDLIFFSFKITRDQQQAEDIVSDGFIKLWDKRNNFEGYSAIKSFLFVETRNRSIDFYRKLKNNTEGHVDIQEAPEEVVYNEYLRAEIIQYLNTLLQLLTPSQRVIIMETLVAGATAQEVADQLHISLGHLYKEKGKAMEIMQSMVREKKMDYPTLLLYVLMLTEFAKRSAN